ncbi:hypothetical protein ONS95_011727 [Cadophora gregata]|uniref:uncharacterized protein n=1 Tax=Cadophora gregata TaxID=51156 RepID=UPI0026DAA332|nr:uncharacterized protein ONS95_011727 [Cadophora gregata]KAK0120321.1 hypothetical protein ONS95_011727 [Cadophora gregata]
MEAIHKIRSLPTRLQNTYPTTINLLTLLVITLLPIFTLTALTLVTFHVYFTGNWYYYNERIFVARGFGEDDAANCRDVLNDTGLYTTMEAVEWYWRRQCEGNRDAWKGDGGVLGVLNQSWIWMIFDVFWTLFLGPCIYAITFFTTTASQIYNSEGITLITAILNACLHAARDAANTVMVWASWLISSWAGFYDFVPLIKQAFATIGDWLKNSTSSLANNKLWSEQVSKLGSRFGEDCLSLRGHPAALCTAVVGGIGDLLNRCTSYLVRVTSNDALFHGLSAIRYYVSLVLVPRTGMPWRFLALIFTVWINVYMHRTFIDTASPRGSRREYWQKCFPHIPFALLNILCFGSEPAPGLDQRYRQPISDGNPTPAFMEWYWDEVPELVMQRVILPIAYRGVWDGFRYWAYHFVIAWVAVARGLKKLSTTVAGSAILMVGFASCVHLHDQVPQFRYVIVGVLDAISEFLFFMAVVTILSFVFLEIYSILKRALTTIFNREPFSQLNPMNPGFWPRMKPILLSQLTIVAILAIFNTITSIMRIPLTLTYTEFLIYAMVFNVLEIRDAHREVRDLDVAARIIAVVLFHMLDWVPITWFWRPIYFLGGMPVPLFAWYTGYVTTTIYHCFYAVSWTGLFEDLKAGLALVMKYLRISGREYIASYGSLQIIPDLQGATITKVQSFISALALVITGYLVSVNLQAGFYFVLLCAGYLLKDQNHNLNKSPHARPELLPLRATLKKVLGVPIRYLIVLPILVQLSGDPYMELEATFPAVAGAFALYGIYRLFIHLRNSGSTQQAVIEFIKLNGITFIAFTVLAIASPYIRLLEFHLRQLASDATPYLFQPLTFMLGALASYFIYITSEDDPAVAPSEFRTLLECNLQICAALFTLGSLAYLPFTLAFYAVFVPIFLLFLYRASPTTATTTPVSQPHGLQAIFWNEPVPKWVKHLWWIVPICAVWESVYIVRYSEAMIRHFDGYDFEFFSEAWGASSLLAMVFVAVTMVLNLLVHVMKEPHPRISLDCRQCCDRISTV